MDQICVFTNQSYSIPESAKIIISELRLASIQYTLSAHAATPNYLEARKEK